MLKILTANFKRPLQTIRKNPFPVIITISILFPLFLSFNNILTGSIPFWFDPARDFLLALDNIKKPVLIGPPSGIPGVFYGPYWIWMISIGLLVSKDPRVVAAFVSLLPYFTVFPFVLFRFSHIFDKKISLLLWLLFIFSFQTYSTFLWNPHLAPLLFLILTYLLISISTVLKTKKYLIKILGAGITSGLLLNFHISFGLGIFIASLVYLFLTMVFKINKKTGNIFGQILYRIFALFLFLCGFLITLIPYIIFEFRHDFLQSRALYTTIMNSLLYNSASVGQIGLKPSEIVSQLFFERTAQLFSVKSEYILPIYLLVIGFIIYQLVRKKISFRENEKNIILYALICLSTLLILFSSSKNPVWQYHFIGVEIIILLLTGIVLKKWELLRNSISFWVAVFAVSSCISFLSPFKPNALSISSLSTKKYIADQVFLDSHNQSFAVFVYSPAIYTYDFDYLFKWLGEEIYHALPEKDIANAKFVYLIIPKTTEAIQLDFINYRTPEKFYTTENRQTIPDGTVIIKRTKINPSEKPQSP